MASQTQVYSGIARTFHWITAIGVLTMIPAGFFMLRVGPGALQNTLFDFHRSMGVLLFGVTVIRLLYRISHNPVPLPDYVSKFQRVASRIVHYTLYGFLLLSPIVGWIGTSAYGAKIKVFGLFVLPAIVEKDRALASIVLQLHEIMGLIFTIALIVHIGAALQHHFIKRDEILVRMLTGRINK